MARRGVKVEWAKVDAPVFELPEGQPEVGAEEYASRLEEVRRRASAEKLDFLLVYGDREHFANLAFLTGFDARFEEALLVVPADDAARPTLVVGNEGAGYSEVVPIAVECRLFQGFSLLGQKRDAAPRLAPILRDCGLRRGSRVGVAGWKYADGRESDEPATWLETPAYVVDLLRTLTGKAALVTNATAIFMNPDDGLRTVNSADQLAVFEFAAAHASQSVRDLIQNLRPGQTELEAVRHMGLNGLPWSCHLMFSAGPRARIGLPSPGSRVIERGDPFIAAFGLWGGLTARAGFVAEGTQELGEPATRYLDWIVKPYFATAAAWYRTIGLGVSGGELQDAVDGELRRHDLELTLNPGHLIHLDEWVHSPVAHGSNSAFRSGMLVQADMIPVATPPMFGTNIEDTIALADAKLRKELAARHPGLCGRVQARRRFMEEGLGIKLRPEVLPFSNMPAMLQPFALRPEMMMRVV